MKALNSVRYDVLVVFVATVISVLVVMFTVTYANNRAIESAKQNTDRIIEYQKCTSLLRYNNGDKAVTPEQVDDCIKRNL